MARNVELLFTTGPLGNVRVPVKVINAVKGDDDDSSDIKTICLGDAAKPHPPTKVNQLMRCKTCATEKSSHWAFRKGRENTDGTWSVIPQDASVDVDETIKKTLTVTIHDRADVERNTMHIGRDYYLDVRSDSPKDIETYTALRDAFDRARARGKSILIEFAVQSAPAWYEIVRHGDVMVLEELAQPNKINQPPVIIPVSYDDAYNGYLDSLIDSQVGEFDPATFVDSRKVKLTELLRTVDTVAGTEAPTEPAAAASGGSLIDLLKASQAKAAKKAPKRAKKVAEESVPAQPLPSEVPDNVDTTLVAAAPKRSRAKKSA